MMVPADLQNHLSKFADIVLKKYLHVNNQVTASF